MKEKIGVECLKIGMFIADLDRPWLDTPFLIEGFLIETDEEIAKLKYYCKHVIVDRGRSAGDEVRSDGVRQSPATRRTAAPKINVFKEQAKQEIQDGASSSLFGTLRTIIKETFKSQLKPGGGTTSARALMIQTVNPPRPRAVEVQVFAHGITHDEAVKLEKEEVDLSGRPMYRPSGRFPGFMGRVKDAVKPAPKPRLLSENEYQDEDEVAFSRPVYPDLTNFEEEVAIATKTHADAEQVVNDLVSDIRADRVPDLERAEETVGVMTESVTRNPDALMWLARLKSRDVYTYDHGLNASIYLLAFGRHLGLAQDQIRLLGTAGLLQDIGKMKLPRELLEKQGKMSSSEYNTVKSHVGYSLDMIKGSKHTTQLIYDIVAQHHERHNGSGYPKGYRGDQISMYGAMAGIADVYAAVTSTRPYGLPLAPQEALSQLFSWRGTVFHEKLVEEFIQAVGVFPVGSLVELNTGEVAAVVAQNRALRLKPRILLVLDPNKQPYTSPIMLDMLFEPPTPSGEPYRIVKGLRIGAHDVDPREQFLFGDVK